MGLTNNFKCIIRTDLHGKWINIYSYRLNHVVATTDITFGGGGGKLENFYVKNAQKPLISL